MIKERAALPETETHVTTKRDALEEKHVVAYSLGHFSNDLCSACWSFYLVFYLKFIVDLSPEQVGFVLLTGQFAYGITTPIVGALSDKVDTPLGKRVPWYIFGSILVLPTFLIMFIHPFKQVSGDDGVPAN